MAEETLSGLVGAFGSLFPSNEKGSGNTTSSGTASSNTIASRAGESRKRLEISQEAIDKIIQDVLAGADGLAAIFAGENSAGIFNSSSANLAAGDLAAKIVGEIAKLQAEEVATTDETETQDTTQEFAQQGTSQTTAKKGGILDGVGDFLGF